MTTSHPDVIDVVGTSDGERIFVADWAGEEPPILYVHGMASTSAAACGVASALAGRHRVVAVDLRGRGCSTKPSAGSYGIDRHADDMVDVMDALGMDRVVLAGHSFGAYIATAVAAREPDRALGLVLLDGGVTSLDVRDEVDAEAALERMLRPLLGRLGNEYPTVGSFLEDARTLPHFADTWGPLIERYQINEVGLGRGSYVVKCSEQAIRDDARDLATNPNGPALLAAVQSPILVIGAEFGTDSTAPPVITDEAMEAFIGGSVVRFVRVSDTTHVTLTLGERGAELVADELANFASGLVHDRHR